MLKRKAETISCKDMAVIMAKGQIQTSEINVKLYSEFGDTADIYNTLALVNIDMWSELKQKIKISPKRSMEWIWKKTGPLSWSMIKETIKLDFSDINGEVTEEVYVFEHNFQPVQLSTLYFKKDF